MVSTVYSVSNAASLSPSSPLPQKRSRQRRTYQLDNSSTKAAMARAVSVILYSASPSSTNWMSDCSLESTHLSISEKSSAFAF